MVTLDEPDPAALPQAAAAPALIVQLVAPVQGGVRDYMDALRSGWQAQGRASAVLELSQALAAAQPLAQRLQALAGGAPCTLLLHFSGYGFHPRGLCGWLVREVEAARTALGSQLRVVTMFHELYASGPPWRSAFWLGGVQAAVAARLARASDAVVTNSTHHAAWLGSRTKAGVVPVVQPVFSTVGEPRDVPPQRARARRLVVFGAASTRARALQRLPAHAPQLRAHGITEVLEAGSGAATRWTCGDLQHRALGRLSEAELRQLLQTSAYGVIDYPSVHLGKSTVYAAYAVHGMAVLDTAPPGPDADGLRHGTHFHTLGESGLRWIDDPQGMADAARRWYAPHALAAQLEAFAHQCDAAWRR